MTNKLTFAFYSLLMIFISVTSISCNNKAKIVTETTDEKQTNNDKQNKKDKENNDQSEISAADIVGVYTITDMEMKSDGEPKKNVYDQLNYCQKHGAYGFNKDMVWYLGGVSNQSCTGTDESGTWFLQGKKLTIKSTESGAYNYTIQSFDGKELILISQVENNGKASVLTTTFTKKSMGE